MKIRNTFISLAVALVGIGLLVAKCGGLKSNMDGGVGSFVATDN